MLQQEETWLNASERKIVDIRSSEAIRLRDTNVIKDCVEVFSTGYLGLFFYFTGVLRTDRHGTFVYGHFGKGPNAYTRCMLRFHSTDNPSDAWNRNRWHDSPNVTSCEIIGLDELATILAY